MRIMGDKQDEYSDRAEIRAIIKAAKDKKKPRSALYRGRFGIMTEKRLLKRRKVVMIGKTIKLVKGD